MNHDTFPFNFIIFLSSSLDLFGLHRVRLQTGDCTHDLEKKREYRKRNIGSYKKVRKDFFFFFVQYDSNIF